MENLEIDQLPREETLVRLLELGQRYGLTTAARLARARSAEYQDGAWDAERLGPLRPLSESHRRHFAELRAAARAGLR